MERKEAIIVDVPSDVYQQIAAKAVRYALISVGFTYNRMEKEVIMTRIENIAKGKIAEGLFSYYCESVDIGPDFDACTTPFWMPDQRDFLWYDGEWDIKNNFITCSDSDFDTLDFTSLPALIPNKFDGDQWSKRNDQYHKKSRFTAYLFTFMRLKPDDKKFVKIFLTEDQLKFIANTGTRLGPAYHGRMPFEEGWFFEQLNERGGAYRYSLSYYPEFIITASANARYWSLFENTSVHDESVYQNYESSPWYHKSETILRFLNGILVTRIRNKTCPVALLPAFSMIVEKYKA